MTGVPPLAAPSSHMSPIWSLFVTVTTFFNSRGASGIVKIIAPFPKFEYYETPTKLVAETLT
jgi:hypothetical protein